METPVVRFSVNPKLLAAHLIRNSGGESFIRGADTKSVVDFQNAAWEAGKDAYNVIRYGFTEMDFLDETLVEKARSCEEFIEKVLQMPELQTAIDETSSSLEMLKAEWELNLEKSSKEVTDIMGRSITGEWDVYVTHPAIKSGQNMGKGILRAYRSDWPNYSTVYLWHEILHSVFRRNATEHAIIELIADNELRVRLNGGSYPPFEGHTFLNEERTKLFPAWQKYLASPSRNIEVFTNAVELES